MLYFNHDTNASRSPDLTAMRSDKGSGAVDAYWMIVELIHENETALVFGENQILTKAVSSWLATNAETLMDWIDYMVEIGLLVRTDNPDGSFSVTSSRAKANIAAYHQKAETARQNGKKGGRKPKQNQGETNPVSNGKPPAKLSKSKSKSKSKEESESYNPSLNQTPSDKSKPRDEGKSSRFSPPSVEEVRAYCAEKGYAINPEHFVDFYESKGWMVGRNKMKDWKASVRTWVKRREEEREKDGKKVPSIDFSKYDD